MNFPAQRTALGSPQKLVHFLPDVRVKDNRRVGGSTQSDGTTNAHGTLFPTNLTAQSGSGSIQSGITNEYDNLGGFSKSSDYVAQNGSIIKTVEAWTNRIKALKRLAISTLIGEDRVFTYASGTYKVIFQKHFDVASDKFLMIRSLTGSTEAVVCTATTAGDFTVGTAVQIIASELTIGNIHVVQMTQTKYLALYKNGSNFVGRCWTISGSTITMGTEFTIGSGTNPPIFHGAYVTTDKVLAVAYTTTTVTYYMLNTSGTTITAPTTGSVTTTGTTPMVSVDGAGTSCAFMYLSSVSSLTQFKGATISGNTLTFGTEITSGFSTSFYPARGNCSFESPTTGKFFALAHAGVTPNSCYLTMSGANITIANYCVISGAWGVSSLNGGNHPVMFKHSATEFGLWYLYSTSATEGNGGLRYVEITCDNTNNTLSASNHDTSVFESLLGIMNSYSNQSCMAVGNFGSYQIITNLYSTNHANIWYYLGYTSTVEIYNQTGALVDGTVCATLTTTNKSLAYYNYTVGKAVGAPAMYIKQKLTSATSVVIRTWRALLSMQ